MRSTSAELKRIATNQERLPVATFGTQKNGSALHEHRVRVCGCDCFGEVGNHKANCVGSVIPIGACTSWGFTTDKSRDE